MKFLFLALALSSLVSADDFPVKVAPFVIKTELEGVLIPTQTQTFSLSPERWTKFTVVSVPSHGAELKKGDALITLDTEAIEESLLNLTDDLATKELQLAIAQRELAELQQKNALSLAAAKRTLDEAEQDFAYYKEVDLPASKDDATYSIVRAKDYLAYSNEELVQLLKMYEEDDITEETEEIILVRQKATVRDAERNLKATERKTAHTLETTLPRRTVSYELAIENASIAYATAKLNLDREYELKKLEIKKLTRNLENAKKALAETEADRKLFETAAEFDGHLLYGEFADGVWNKGKTEEFLKTNGSLPTESVVLTLVAKDSPLSLQALVSSKRAQEISALAAEDTAEAESVTIASYPNLDGKHLVSLAPEAPSAFQFPGLTEKKDVVFYENTTAITIPAAVVKKAEDGTSYVLVKLSEGEPEQRTIELGRKSGESLEVLSGLEEGQVILP